VIAVVALPIVMSAYVGVAEAARDVTLQQLQRKRDGSGRIRKDADDVGSTLHLFIESLDSVVAIHLFGEQRR
jgi:hypothetical protein